MTDKKREGRRGLRLSIGNFLKILPIRKKKIEDAPDSDVRKTGSYKPNELAGIIHPGLQHLIVTQVKDLTEDVKLYRLEADRENGCERLAPFGAGSYLTFEMTVGSGRCSRPYSICSSPKDAIKGFYEIAVRRTPRGVVSNYIHENWKEGTRVTAQEPAGEFLYEPVRDAKHVICLAGGTGITPFRSMVKAVLEGSEDFRIDLIYSARKEKELLFREELDGAAGTDERISVRYVLSDEEKAGYGTGFITKDMVAQAAQDGEPYSVFICGPQKMYRYLDGELKGLDLRKKYVRRELFGEIRDLSDEEDYVRPDADEFTLTVSQNGQRTAIRCRRDESLLCAMERAGIAAPSRCRSGVCGFCHSKLVNGSCYTPAQSDFRREADRLYGYIHPCCAYPLSDLEIDVPAAGKIKI